MAYALYFIHALSSVHAGTGQGIDAIDLPIARERSTTLPFIPGSSLKGCLRDQAQGQISLAEVEAIFGPDRESAADEEKRPRVARAGALSVGDGRLVLFPVRSLAGTFVWATSPFLLDRLRRDASDAGLSGLPESPAALDDNAALVSNSAALLAQLGDKLILEEHDLAGRHDPGAKHWAEWFGTQLFPDERDAGFRGALLKQFAIISDRVLFSLARTATDVQAHIALDNNTGTVANGALWYQESLPAETVMVGVLRSTNPRGGPATGLSEGTVIERALDTAKALQIGGKAGTGQGWVRLARAGGAA